MATRSTRERIENVRTKLENDVDVWVASANEHGDAYVIPLSFSWDGAYLTVATPKHSRTARNLRRAGRARMALGPTRDVVILEGPIKECALDADPALAEEHAVSAGFDARAEPAEQDYILIRLEPRMIQAWRTPEELAGRDVMRDGRWLE